MISKVIKIYHHFLFQKMKDGSKTTCWSNALYIHDLMHHNGITKKNTYTRIWFSGGDINSYQDILYNPKGSWFTLYLMHHDTKRPLPHINIINLYIFYM